MPKIGYCSECDTDVELNDEGACPLGHASDCVFDLREQAVADAPPRQPAGSRPRATKSTWAWVAAAVIAALVVAAMASGRGGAPVSPPQTATPPVPQQQPVAAAEVPPQNGEQNPSFEDWSGPAPTGWSLSGTARSGSVTQRPDWKRSGARGAGLANSSDDSAQTTELWQPIVVEAGKTYRASIWAVSDRDPSCVRISIRFVDAKGKVLAESTTSGDKAGSSSSAWRQLTVTETAPEAAVAARVVLVLAGGDHVSGNGSPSTAVFDDLRFETSGR